MRPIALVFEAADDRPLAATVLEPSRVEGAVVISSATGVPRRIYEGVAGCLADAGLAVLTFDYRGIGGSREGGPLRLEPARMQDWGRLDLEGALRDYDEAIRLKPDFDSAYYNRGRLYKKKGERQAAITNYQKYLDLGGGIRDGDQAKVEKIIRDLKKR